MKKLNRFTGFSLAKDKKGMAAIEFAMIVPFLMILLISVVEFGLYFTKQQIVSRAVTNISNSLQANPDGDYYAEAQATGDGLINYTAPNYFCAKSFATRQEATAYCDSGWITGAPTQQGSGYIAGKPYYVAFKVNVKYKSLTPLSSYMPDIIVRNIIQINPSISNNSHGADLIKGWRADTSTTLSSSGTWNVPAGVKDIKVTMINGGAAGTPRVSASVGGYGGNGGNGIIAYIKLKPGVTSIPYTVGRGGIAPTTNTSNASMAGSQAYFGGMSVSTADNPTYSGFDAAYGTYDLTYGIKTFKGNKGGAYVGNYKTNGDDKIWVYTGGIGGDGLFGFGSGGMPSFGATGEDSGAIHASGYGSGGAGKSYHSDAGHGGGSFIMIEW